MARIRTVKPELFRHEELQDLQEKHHKLHPMLVFIALFTQCDKNGVFPWRPKYLKLDILPFLNFDLGASLLLLRENGFIRHMIHEEKEYGYIPTFADHQRISGKEAQEDSKYPEPIEMQELTQGSNGEAPEKLPGAQEGKGKEGKRKGKGMEYSREFENFWVEYPKKKEKPEAYKEWVKLSPGESLIAIMMEALSSYKISREWNEDDGKYIPYPERWIKKRRWEDEINSNSVIPITETDFYKDWKGVA